jgi:hypothetical protein
MAPQLTDEKLDDPRLVHAAAAPPLAARDREVPEDEWRAARGIVIGILIASPLWALIGFTLYLLL